MILRKKYVYIYILLDDEINIFMFIILLIEFLSLGLNYLKFW